MSAMDSPESEEETFEFEQNSDAPDLWVDETFTNRYGDERGVLGGDSYGVLVDGGVKEDLDWDTIHHKFDGQRKEWLVDIDGLEHLANVADEHGFAVATETNDGVNDEDPLFDAAEHANEGAIVQVEYVQKNGNGTNLKSGEVRSATITHDGTPVIVFVRDDGQTMRVKPDERGDAGLFTGGYHPFVGAVTTLNIKN